ncbi:GxxExxY protein [Fluviicola chungangensis]|uniref:GxxExxY protein n=1 Tax=Fluviicola chungangensis TaxID=2597671 RepID=A0A556MQN7_9FLAO|nr:GxxExxY protein [Fluviicola chungangensis]TSJ42274.1 GxxExxY protein [Fluviicola chungangensis]
MTENEISYKIRGAIFEIYNTVGPGLLESVYEAALYYELKKDGLKVERQIEVPFLYKDVRLDVAYRLDLIVEDKVIIELKSVTDFSALHFKQLTTYLRLTNLKLGLLVNFNTSNMREGIARIVNNL